MKHFIFLFVFVCGISTYAQDEAAESAVQKPSEKLQDSVDKVEPKINKGTIQKTTPETKKIVKKIMNRKKKSKSEKERTTESQEASKK